MEPLSAIVARNPFLPRMSPQIDVDVIAKKQNKTQQVNKIKVTKEK
jgi:hypothetical protein